MLKSKNFKLLKKLAVYDAFNDSHLSSDPSSRKRIGTLHVNIELTSDLNQFHADLVKLKKYEQNNFADSKKKHEHEKQQKFAAKAKEAIETLKDRLAKAESTQNGPKVAESLQEELKALKKTLDEKDERIKKLEKSKITKTQIANIQKLKVRY